MLTMSVYPKVAFPAVSALPIVKTWSDIAGLYRDAMGASTQQLILSSTRIVQEQTLRAFISASQACNDALAKNALSVQQDSMARLLDANAKASGMLGQALTRAWVESVRRGK